jgi:lipoic acid synthetase
MINRLPSWFRQDIIDECVSEKIKLLACCRVHTVCQEARCPNLTRCFKEARLTFLILGGSCTRNCRFCAVKKSASRIADIDLDEPYRVQEAIRSLNITYAVITSVTRDDLKDGGAGVFAKTIALIFEIGPNITVEALIPDFSGEEKSLEAVVAVSPDVLAHNIETVRRLYRDLRPQADYFVSLGLLLKAKKINPGLITKSSLMLGLGEKEEEVIEAMQDLRRVDCDILALGQYLSPAVDCYPVKEFIAIEQFEKYRKIGLDLGFKAVASGPLVRSSYQAERAYRESLCMI